MNILPILAIILLSALTAAYADEETDSFRVYFIGNSVTDTIRYGAFAELAESRGVSLVWGRHMIPGAPLEWIYDHPSSGFAEQPFGHYPQALGKFAWDAISVQPFDRHLYGTNEKQQERGDVEMIRFIAARAANRNADVQVYIYARWPRITSAGKSLEFDKNDYDPAKPGSGADLSEADPYADRWNAEYTGAWDMTNESRDYFERLLREVRRATPFLRKPAMLVPVGHVMLRMDEKMRAGEIPGYTSVYQLYRDSIHLDELGSYLVGCTFYATMMQRSPVGLPTKPYGALDPNVAQMVQRTAWEVVKQSPDGGTESRPRDGRD